MVLIGAFLSLGMSVYAEAKYLRETGALKQAVSLDRPSAPAPKGQLFRGGLPRWWYGIALNLALALLCLGGATLFARYARRNTPDAGPPRLEIWDAGSGKLYESWPLEGYGAVAGEFAIEFVHSVNQSPVRETFLIEGALIRPKAVRFSSFGAGMLSDLEEGQTLGRDGEALVITGFNRTFSELNYIVGTVSDHLLFIGDETVSLRELCGKNAHIRVLIK